MQHIEHARQVIWPALDVQVVSVTEQWAQYAIAGPNSRQLLARLLGDAIDVSNDAFPYLACAEFSWNGVIARLFRISFSGELGFELAVPARYGDSVIRAIMAAGAEWGVVPYGTEALGVMRIEKGHVAGNELNGTTTTLVGVKPVDPKARLYAGAHFLSLTAKPSQTADQGYLTSIAFSPALGIWIGLGLLTRGSERHGERFELTMDFGKVMWRSRLCHRSSLTPMASVHGSGGRPPSESGRRSACPCARYT